MAWLRRGLFVLAALAALGLAALAWVGQRAAAALLTPASLRAALGDARPPGPTLADLGLPVEPVGIETPLGPAPALWIPAGRAGPPLAALFVHGIAGHPEDGAAFAAALHALGVPVLLIGYRNDEGAPADPSGLYGMGLTEWPDAVAGLDWLRARGEERILLVGASMGGAIVGQVAARPEAMEGVVGLALDSPAVDGPATLAHVLGRLGVPLPRLAAALGAPVAAWRTGVDLRRARVAETLAASPLPLFLVHGAADSVVPPDTSEALAARRAAPTVLVRTGGDHLSGWATDPALVGGAFAGFVASLE